MQIDNIFQNKSKRKKREKNMMYISQELNPAERNIVFCLKAFILFFMLLVFHAYFSLLFVLRKNEGNFTLIR